MATAGMNQGTTQSNTFIARNWRDLIRPRKLEVDADSLTPTYGKFTCEPLERGFGTTLGNSLRRILLSSLQGSAITAINIEEVPRKCVDSKARAIRIEKDGEGKISAGDIILTDGVEVLNPDHHVLTCAKGAKLRIELQVGTGRGYVPAERNKT